MTKPGVRVPRKVPKSTYRCGHCPLVFHHLMHLAQHGIVAHGLKLTGPYPQ